MITLNVRPRDLCEEVMNDIESHLYEWSLWNYIVESEENRITAENEIKEKLVKLRDVLKEYDNRYKRT